MSIIDKYVAETIIAIKKLTTVMTNGLVNKLAKYSI